MGKTTLQTDTIAKRKVGRPLQFETAEQLWDACVDYFDWVEEPPLIQTKLAQSGGVPIKIEVPLPRNDNLKLTTCDHRILTTLFYHIFTEGDSSALF